MKLAVVTGASRGIGFATAKRLSIEGYHTILISQSKSRLVSASHLIQNSNSIQFDLKQPIDGLLRGIHDIEESLGVRTSVLVHAAGSTLNRLLLSTKQEQMQDLIQLNLNTPMLLTQGLLKGMIKQRDGSIVFVSSVVGSKGTSGLSIYGATKAGLVGFTKSLAKEVGRKGVRINSISPGYIDTDMTRDLKIDLETIPLNRFGTADEVADAIQFLVRNPYVNGTDLVLDGGLSC